MKKQILFLLSLTILLSIHAQNRRLLFTLGQKEKIELSEIGIIFYSGQQGTIFNTASRDAEGNEVYHIIVSGNRIGPYIDRDNMAIFPESENPSRVAFSMLRKDSTIEVIAEDGSKMGPFYATEVKPFIGKNPKDLVVLETNYSPHTYEIDNSTLYFQTGEKISFAGAQDFYFYPNGKGWLRTAESKDKIEVIFSDGRKLTPSNFQQVLFTEDGTPMIYDKATGGQKIVNVAGKETVFDANLQESIFSPDGNEYAAVIEVNDEDKRKYILFSSGKKTAIYSNICTGTTFWDKAKRCFGYIAREGSSPYKLYFSDGTSFAFNDRPFDNDLGEYGTVIWSPDKNRWAIELGDKGYNSFFIYTDKQGILKEEIIKNNSSPYLFDGKNQLWSHDAEIEETEEDEETIEGNTYHSLDEVGKTITVPTNTLPQFFSGYDKLVLWNERNNSLSLGEGREYKNVIKLNYDETIHTLYTLSLEGNQLYFETIPIPVSGTKLAPILTRISDFHGAETKQATSPETCNLLSQIIATAPTEFASLKGPIISKPADISTVYSGKILFRNTQASTIEQFFGKYYHVLIATSASESEIQAKLTQWVAQFNSCLPDYEHLSHSQTKGDEVHYYCKKTDIGFLAPTILLYKQKSYENGTTKYKLGFHICTPSENMYIYSPTYSNTGEFESTIAKILADLPHNFANLKGAKDGADYLATICFATADKCIITKSLENTIYEASWESTDKAEVVKKQKEIVEKLYDCLGIPFALKKSPLNEKKDLYVMIDVNNARQITVAIDSGDEFDDNEDEKYTLILTVSPLDFAGKLD